MSDELIRREIREALDGLVQPVPDLANVSREAVRRGRRRSGLPSRLLPITGVLIAILLIGVPVAVRLVGGGTQSRPTGSGPWTTETRQEIRFAYPASWHENHSSAVSSFSDVIASVSNQPLHDPCSISGNRTSCGPPIDFLGPDGVLVQWWRNGFPGFSFDRQPGKLTTVGGRRAKLRESKPDPSAPSCNGLGADDAFVVVVEDQAAPDNYYEMTACLSGPGVAAERAVVMRILNSVAFLSPVPEPPPTPSPSPQSAWIVRTVLPNVFFGPLAVSPSYVFALSTAASGPDVGYTTLWRVDRTTFATQSVQLTGNSGFERALDLKYEAGWLWILGSNQTASDAPGTERWLEQIDPATLKVNRTVALPAAMPADHAQAPLTSDSSTLWVGIHDTLYWIDPNDGRLVSTEPLGGQIGDLSVDPSGQRLYVGLLLAQPHPGDTNEVDELNATTGTRIAAVDAGVWELGSPGVSASPTGVWIWHATGNFGAVNLYSTSLKLVPQPIGRGTNSLSIQYIAGIVWFHPGYGVTQCFNPTSGTFSDFGEIGLLAGDAGGLYASGQGISSLKIPPYCRV